MRILSPHTVGAGFHARPASDDGLPRFARDNGARAVPAILHTLGSKRYRAHRIKRGCNRSRQTAASNAPRQSSNGRDVEDAAPYGGCETNAAACRVTGTFAPRLPMVRGLCPRDFIRWVVDGGGRDLGDVGAVGHAQRLRLTRPGGHSTAAHRGRCALRATAKRTLRPET